MYGKDVRGSIHDGIDAINKETEAASSLSKITKNKQAILETKYDNQIANMTNENPSISELVDFRTSGFTGETFITAGKRADVIDELLLEQEQRLRESGLNVKSKRFGAIGDGKSHPLSERFETLEKAKSIYPHATSLSQEIDWAAIQLALDECYNHGINYGEDGSTPSIVLIPFGLYLTGDSFVWRQGVKILGTGTMRGNNIVGKSGGTTIMLKKDVNKSVFYANTFIHGSSMLDVKIVQEEGSVLDVSNAHGIHIDGNPKEISGFGELTYLDRVAIEYMGGDGIKFGQGTESQPINLGHLSLHRNQGYGINFDGENYGHVRALSIKGDLKSSYKGKGLIRIANVSGQSNFLFETVGVEADGTGNINEAIMIENTTAPNITIQQLDIRVFGDLSNEAAAIRVKSSTISTSNIGPVLNVVKVVQSVTSGKTGYKYFLYDENIVSASPQSYILMSTVNKKGVITDSVIKYQNNWNNPRAADIYRSVKDGKTWSVGAGNHITSKNHQNDHVMRINHPENGATDGEVAWYPGTETNIMRLLNHGELWLLKSLSLGNAYDSPIIKILTGSGSPEGVVTGWKGWIYLRDDGGSGTTLYVKETGLGNMGWVAK
ncbi:hypothetical protein AW22_5301 [Bacillus cereus D17]|nr:hypothetical protein AW22_5301 [Bacillus cereus D17]